MFALAKFFLLPYLFTANEQQCSSYLMRKKCSLALPFITNVT